VEKNGNYGKHIVRLSKMKDREKPNEIGKVLWMMGCVHVPGL